MEDAGMVVLSVTNGMFVWWLLVTTNIKRVFLSILPLVVTLLGVVDATVHVISTPSVIYKIVYLAAIGFSGVVGWILIHHLTFDGRKQDTIMLLIITTLAFVSVYLLNVNVYTDVYNYFDMGVI